MNGDKEENEQQDEKGDEARARKMREIESGLKTSLRIALDPAAYDRLINVSHSNKELFLVAGKQIILAFRKVQRKITEEEVVMILRAIKEQNEKKTSITFHSK